MHPELVIGVPEVVDAARAATPAGTFLSVVVEKEQLAAVRDLLGAVPESQSPDVSTAVPDIAVLDYNNLEFYGSEVGSRSAIAKVVAAPNAPGRDISRYQAALTDRRFGVVTKAELNDLLVRVEAQISSDLHGDAELGGSDALAALRAGAPDAVAPSVFEAVTRQLASSGRAMSPRESSILELAGDPLPEVDSEAHSGEPPGGPPARHDDDPGEPRDYYLAAKTWGDLQDDLVLVEGWVARELTGIETASTGSFQTVPGQVLTIDIFCDGFAPTSPSIGEVRAPFDGSSAHVSFELAVLVAPTHSVGLTVRDGTRTLARLVIDDFFREPSTTVDFAPEPDIDVTVIVEPEGMVRLFASAEDKYGTLLPEPIKTSLESQTIVASLVEAIQQSTSGVTDEPIRRLGYDVREAMPARLVAVLQDSDAPLGVLIEHAPEFTFPFEWAMLETAGGKEQFLGEAHRVTRCLVPRKPLQSKLSIYGGASVRESDAADHLPNPLRNLQKTINELCHPHTEISSVADLRQQILRDGRFQLIDFLAHVQRERFEGFVLSDGVFPAHRAFLPEEKRFAENGALVVLNGCTSAGPAPGLFDATSYPKRFLDAGATGVVGTLAPVDRRGAATVARALYDQLASGAHLGEALRRCRHEVRATAKRLRPELRIRYEIAALSYCAYGHGELSVEFVGSGTSDGGDRGVDHS
jgi:hypothetical protein